MPQRIAIRSEMASAPDSVGVVAEIMERTADSTRTQPGVPRGRRRTGKFVTVKMPVYERFKPALSVSVPSRYVIPPGDTAVVRVLRLHGITVSKFPSGPPGAELMQRGFVFIVDSTIVAPRPFQGHREMRLVGHWRGETRSVPPGAYVVDLDQPLSLLAIYMLEPQSDDGLVDWNFFDVELKPGGLYPIFRVGEIPPTP